MNPIGPEGLEVGSSREFQDYQEHFFIHVPSEKVPYIKKNDMQY